MNEFHRIVVLSAAAFEVQPLKDQCDALGLSQVEFLELGIGIVRSLMGAMQLKQSLIGADIIFIGTCGTFAEFSSPEIYLADAARWLDLGQRLGLSYKINGDLEDLPLSKIDPIYKDLPKKISLSSATISLTSDLGEVARPKDCYVENLELYGVARALIDQVRSFTAILCSTNLVGGNAHADWKKYADVAADKTADYLLSKITSYLAK